MAGQPDSDGVAVTFVSSHAELGGAQLVLESILEQIDRSWIRSVILLEDGELAVRLRERDIPVEVVPVGRRARTALALPRLRRALKDAGATAVHANDPKAAALTLLAGAGSGFRVIWLKHDRTLDGPIGRTIARRSTELVGVSESALAAMPDKPGHRHVIHNGVPAYEFDRSESRRRVLEELGAAEDADVIVAAGRLCPPKGQDTLVELMPGMLERRPGAHLALLGEENRAYAGFAEALRARASELGLRKRVHMTARRRTVEETVRFVAGCDLLAAPSTREPRSGWEEGFGLSVAEAMQVGTPVVAFRHGSLSEVLGDCGVLVDEGDGAALADAIVSVLGDPAERERMASCGRRRVSERFRREDSIRKMMHLYGDVGTYP